MLDAAGDTKINQAPGLPNPNDLVWKTDMCINYFNMKQTARDATRDSYDIL